MPVKICKHSINKKNFIYFLLISDIILCILDISQAFLIKQKGNTKIIIICGITLDFLIIIFSLINLIKYFKEKKNSKLIQIYSYFRIFLYVCSFILMIGIFFFLIFAESVENFEFFWNHKIIYCVFFGIIIIWCFLNIFLSKTFKNSVFEIDENEEKLINENDENGNA